MRSREIVHAAIMVGIIGAILSLFGMIASGSGDNPEAYNTYLLASSIVFGFGVLATAVLHRDDSR